MTRAELKIELDKISIPENYYSLYDELKPDSVTGRRKLPISAAIIVAGRAGSVAKSAA